MSMTEKKAGVIKSTTLDLTPSDNGYAKILARLALDGADLSTKKWAIDWLCEKAYGVRPFGTPKDD